MKNSELWSKHQLLHKSAKSISSSPYKWTTYLFSCTRRNHSCCRIFALFHGAPLLCFLVLHWYDPWWPWWCRRYGHWHWPRQEVPQLVSQLANKLRRLQNADCWRQHRHDHGEHALPRGILFDYSAQAAQNPNKKSHVDFAKTLEWCCHWQ